MKVRTYGFQVVAGMPEHVVYHSPEVYEDFDSASEVGWHLAAAFRLNNPQWTTCAVVVLTIDTQYTRVEKRS